MCVWLQIKKPTYFIIQLIFVTIYGPHYTFGTIHDPTAFFSIIYGSHYTISANFYFYLQYFQQKIFNFCKISEPQTELYAGKAKKFC